MYRAGPTVMAAAAGAAVDADAVESGRPSAPDVTANVFCFLDGERGCPGLPVATRLIPAFDVATMTGQSMSAEM